MASEDLERDALRLLSGLESGGMTVSQAADLAEELDPVLLYVIVRFLRENYPASDPAATAVLERVVRMTSRNARLIAAHKQGGQDPIARWFEADYGYRDFRGRPAELIRLIVDKIES
jgi:hypothetical protein